MSSSAGRSSYTFLASISSMSSFFLLPERTTPPRRVVVAVEGIQIFPVHIYACNFRSDGCFCYYQQHTDRTFLEVATAGSTASSCRGAWQRRLFAQSSIASFLERSQLLPPVCNLVGQVGLVLEHASMQRRSRV